jgi:DNA-binding MarR family transcriptional regulator
MTNKPKTISAAALKRHDGETLITFRDSVLSHLLARVVESSVGRELGLSSRQWRLLVILNRLGPSTSGQVAAATHLDHSQVSRASYELAEKGLIAMDADTVDRLRQLFSATAGGIALLRQGIVGSMARQDRLRATLSDADYEAFGRVLAVLSDEAHAMLEEGRKPQ